MLLQESLLIAVSHRHDSLKQLKFFPGLSEASFYAPKR